MKVTVVGIARKVTEGEYQGFNYANRSLYVNYSVSGVEGEVAERFKIPDRISDLSGIHVGDVVNVEFNRFGKVVSVYGESN